MKLNAAQLSLPMVGETKNGDAALIRDLGEGRFLLAVIDGLGHGPDAAHASQAAIDLLGGLTAITSAEAIMRDVHQKLKGTRGAAATLCCVEGSEIEACAVGNVTIMCVNCSVPLVVSAGVLGHQVTKFRVCNGSLKPGARLALFSDGISTRFRLEEWRQLEPARACSEIMTRHRRKHDDSTVLIADFSE
jgi:negative regulator of sigma-B (phosphoserine phosphatase)